MPTLIWTFVRAALTCSPKVPEKVSSGCCVGWETSSAAEAPLTPTEPTPGRGRDPRCARAGRSDVGDAEQDGRRPGGVEGVGSKAKRGESLVAARVARQGRARPGVDENEAGALPTLIWTFVRAALTCSPKVPEKVSSGC